MYLRDCAQGKGAITWECFDVHPDKGRFPNNLTISYRGVWNEDVTELGFTASAVLY